MGGDQFTYGVQGTAGGRRWSKASGNGERLVSGKVLFFSVEAQIVWAQTWIVRQNSAVDCNSGPFGSSILSENVRDGNFRVFGGLSKPRFRHS